MTSRVISDPLSQNISTAVIFVGKFCIAGAFAIIYNYTVERFPTVVRNTAIGLGSMFARLAGGFTPLVTLMVSKILNFYIYLKFDTRIDYITILFM